MTKSRKASLILLASSLLACAVQQKNPTEESGKAAVAAYVRAWNEHNGAAFDSLLTRDAIHEDLAQNFRGKGSGQIAEFMQQVIQVEPDYQWRVTNMYEAGPVIALEWTWTSTYSGPDPTGKPVKNKRLTGRGSSIAEIEGGKIKRFTDYYDNASFFR